MAGNPLDVVTKFTSDVSGLQKGATEAKEAIGGISPAALLTGATIVGAAAIAVGAIAGMTQAAIDDQAQQAELEQAYKNTGAATGDYKAQIDAAIESGKTKAFTDDETRAALTSLISATHDAGKANEDLKTAQDIARFAGVDLATAADAVAKAHAGNATQLARLLPGLEKGKTATDTLANASKLAAGAADTYAASTKGQMDVAGVAFSDLGKTLGTAFIPLVLAVIPPITKIVELLGKLIAAIIPPLTVLFTGLGAVLSILVDLWIKEYTWISTVVGWIANRLTPLLRPLADLFHGVADAIGSVVSFLSSLVDWVGKAIDAIGKFFDSVNPLKGFSLPSLPFSLAAPGAAAAGVGVGATGLGGTSTYGTSGGVTVNVYGGDPSRIIDAVRDGFRRWVDQNGRSAPTRDW